MYLTANFTGPTVPLHMAVFLAASVCMIAAGRASDRLWDGIAAPVLRSAPPQICVLSRAPFRFLSGGIAFTTVLLASKKMELAPVRDVPVRDLFMTGGILSLCYFGFIEGFRAYRGSGTRGAEGGGTGGIVNNNQGTERDENRTA